MTPAMHAAELKLDKSVTDARRFNILFDANVFTRDPYLRTRALTKLGIPDGDHTKIIEQTKFLLKTDRILRQDNILYARVPAYRWSLLAVWLAERRLQKETRAIARQCAPERLAAE